MAVREVQWPEDVASVARSVARAGQQGGGWYWLDGEAVEPGGARGRSYLGVAARVAQAVRGAEHDFLAGLRDELHGGAAPGLVVALSYEFGEALLGERARVDDEPPGFAIHADTVLVLDHAASRAEVWGPDEAAIEAWLNSHGAAFSSEADIFKAICKNQGEIALKQLGDCRSLSDCGREAAWRRDEAQYLAAVERCMQAIHEGEAYVLCLTDTAELTCEQVNPLSLYLRLRESGAEVRGGVIATGSRALVSASPERFLSVRGGRVFTNPIKGTRPRGATPERDEALADELANDPKERAENLMIVDLMRNDLSRVCEPGSVEVEGFLRVEQHPRVHQLVSTIAGTLRKDADAIDAIEACFPGGSMTGAPKRRAVQLLAEIEEDARGLYSGCAGWLGADGGAELAMTIRSIELRGIGSGETVARIGAGGGVTADSDPVAEYAEKQLKAAPLIDALSGRSAG